MNRRDFLRTTGGAAAALALGRARAFAQTVPTGPGAIRFAVIGDFGQTFPEQIFPLDHVAAVIRSWNPDFVVSVRDNNYQLCPAATAVISGHVHNYERLEMPDANAQGEPLYGQPTIPYCVNRAGGGVDMGSYTKKRVKIPVPASDGRLFIRFLVRPKS